MDDAGPIIVPVDLTDAQRQLLGRLAAAIEPLGIGGAWVEHKATSVVLHTRPMQSRDAAADLRERARAIGQRVGGIVLDGKELIEFAVVRSTKGEAVATLRRDHRAGIVLYAGDDVTDETVFTLLTRDDVGIRVGEGTTAARWRVPDPAEMVAFLGTLADRLEPRDTAAR
jgi:trehalose 6-phosphate phosphatase